MRGSNCKQECVEKSPAKPFDRQPSTAHGDLEAFKGELCLDISMQSSVLLLLLFPDTVCSQFAGMYDLNLLLFKLITGFRFVLSGKMLIKDPISST